MGFANNNVVSIYNDTEYQGSLNSSQLANITAAVKSIATMHLTMLFRAMFAELDNTLFDLSDGFINRCKKMQYDDNIVELRAKNKQIELLFIKRFEELFGQTLLQTPQKVDEVSLVGSLEESLKIENAELETSIMLTHFAAKADKGYEDKLDLLQKGFEILLKGAVSSGQKNPVAPVLICDAFKVATDSLDKDTVHKAIVFDYFDHDVIQSLGEMYDQINALFIRTGLNT